MSTDFSKGDKVQWESSQGTIEGTVEKKLTEPIDLKSIMSMPQKTTLNI